MNPDKKLSQLRERLVASNTRDKAIIDANVAYTAKMEQLLDAAMTNGDTPKDVEGPLGQG